MDDVKTARWYAKPDMMVGIGALVVSLCAVCVSLYGAALQRAHDRAEVWPRLEFALWTTPKGADLYLQNTGIGPALVEYVRVTVDGKPVADWNAVLSEVLGAAQANFDHAQITDHALRAGDRTDVLGIENTYLPPGSIDKFMRVGVDVCYASVFQERWRLVTEHLGGPSRWEKVDNCPHGPATEF
jgi:hypothetical protein